MNIEINQSFKEANTAIETKGHTILITPPLDADYFIARVPLYKEQAIVIFPKFGLIGCGFAVEEKDWNTNLPIQVPAEELWDHIKVNRKYPKAITKERGIEAIKLLQQWCIENRLIKAVGRI